MYCKYCGKEVEEGKEYCADCEPKEEVVVEETKVEEVVEPVETEVKVEEPKVETETNFAEKTTYFADSRVAAHDKIKIIIVLRSPYIEWRKPYDYRQIFRLFVYQLRQCRFISGE